MSKKQIKMLTEEFERKISAEFSWGSEDVIALFQSCLKNAEFLCKKAPSDKLFPRMIEVYNTFCINKIGVKAKIGVVEGVKMKSIIKYLGENVKDKDGGDESVLSAWEFILTNIGRWDTFHQKQLKLSQIESNLINILNSIKNGNKQKNTIPSQSSSSITERIFNSPEMQRRRDYKNNNDGEHLS